MAAKPPDKSQFVPARAAPPPPSNQSVPVIIVDAEPAAAIFEQPSSKLPASRSAPSPQTLRVPKATPDGARSAPTATSKGPPELPPPGSKELFKQRAAAELTDPTTPQNLATFRRGYVESMIRHIESTPRLATKDGLKILAALRARQAVLADPTGWATKNLLKPKEPIETQVGERKDNEDLHSLMKSCSSPLSVCSLLGQQTTLHAEHQLMALALAACEASVDPAATKHDAKHWGEAADKVHQAWLSTQVPWRPIAHPIQLSGPQHPELTSIVLSQIPACAMRSDSGHRLPGYIDEQGRTAFAAEGPLPNLWLSTCAPPPSGIGSRPGVAGINLLRHGTLAPFGINAESVEQMDKGLLKQYIDDAKAAHIPGAEGIAPANISTTTGIKRKADTIVEVLRKHIALLRAKELVTAALLSNRNLMEQVLRGSHVEINMTSIGLLSPDGVRPYVSGDEANERAMVDLQHEALLALSGRPLHLEIPGPGGILKVHVTPQICDFNLGVNVGAVGDEGLSAKLKASVGKASGIFGHTLEQNTQAMRVLDQRRRIFAERADLSIEQRELAGALWRDIETIWGGGGGSYQKAGDDPYKLVSRIALLSALMDNPTCINCKSGKDRTSFENAEVDFLYLHYCKFGTLPPHDRPLTHEQRDLMWEIIQAGGHREIQVHSTGGAGTKLEGIEAIFRRFADEADPIEYDRRKRIFLGISKQVPA